MNNPGRDWSAFELEFATVNIVQESGAVTAQTDAYVLSWVKLEKQCRKLFSFIVFQLPVFDSSHVHDIIKVISENRNLYWWNFIRGFDLLYQVKLSEIIGPNYDDSLRQIKHIEKVRHKVLHGQLTGDDVNADELIEYIQAIRGWCFQVAQHMFSEIGYDGFSRPSFTKSGMTKISDRLSKTVTNCAELKKFLGELTRNK